MMLSQFCRIALLDLVAQSLVAVAQSIPVSLPQLVNSYAPIDSGLDGAPTLVHVGGRAFLCLWLGYDDGSASTGTDLDIYSSYSPDGGVTWEDYVLVSDYGDEDGYSENLPSVTVSNDGSLVFATWRLDLGTEHDIIGVTSNDGGRTWGQAGWVSEWFQTDTFDDYGPHVAATGTGSDLILFFDSNGLTASTKFEVGFLRYINGAWDKVPVALQTPGTSGNNQDARVATSASSVVACWTTTDPAAYNPSPGSNPFIIIVRASISPDPFPASPQFLIQFASTGSSTDEKCNIASDNQQVFVAVWQSNSATRGSGSDSDIFFTRSDDGGSSWSTENFINQDATTDAFTDLCPCGIASDRKGNWIVTWDRAPSGGLADAVFSTSSDNGLSWGAPQALHDSNGFDDFAPTVATDLNGNWVVAWYGQFSAANTDVEVQSVRVGPFPGESESPTAAPTANPSISPSSSPSTAPTANPSISPSSSPSTAPTANPSIPPSDSPSTAPTANPSISPSSSPSTAPTANPTSEPTNEATNKPTTANPTLNPTSSPSVSPSSPSSFPTNSPSFSPTGSPSTHTPSSSPTLPLSPAPTPPSSSAATQRSGSTNSDDGDDLTLILVIVCLVVIVALCVGAFCFKEHQKTKRASMAAMIASRSPREAGKGSGNRPTVRRAEGEPEVDQLEGVELGTVKFADTAAETIASMSISGSDTASSDEEEDGYSKQNQGREY